MFRKALSALCGALLALCAALACLAFLIDGAGCSAPLMEGLLRQHAPAETTGLPEEHYPAMARMIAGYLGGEVETFQYTLDDADAFNPKEKQHMADVRQLFVLCRKVLLVSVTALVALGICAWLLRENRRVCAKGFLWATLAALLLLAAAGIWAALDFDSLFILFHQLSFSNDLWLLDPRTDLLIRLMPIGFFIHYAALIGGTWLGLLLLMAAVAWRLSTRWKL